MKSKRVERIWRRAGLTAPETQPKKGRLWLNGGSCIRLRSKRESHVRACKVVEPRTRDGRIFRMRLAWSTSSPCEALAIVVTRRLNSSDVLEILARLMLARGMPTRIRSDNGPEFAVAVRERLVDLGVDTAFIAPGNLCENGYTESVNSKLRDELLDGEIF